MKHAFSKQELQRFSTCNAPPDVEWAGVIQVEENINTQEQVAQIHPDEAEHIAHELWASQVEHSMNSCTHFASSVVSDSSTHPRIMVIRFSRASTRLDEALLQTPLALHAIANGVECQPGWANGAKVLTEWIDGPDIDIPGVELLTPSDVVIREVDELPLMDALRELLPYRVMKCKPGKRYVPNVLSLFDGSAMSSEVAFSSGSAVASGASMSEPIEYTVMPMPVKNTFIHFEGSKPDMASIRAKTV